MSENSRGGIGMNVILVLLLVVIGVLVYILMGGDISRNGRTIGTELPAGDLTRPAPAAPVTAPGEFNDGLGRAESVTEYPLDEFGSGLARTDVFRRDINNDGHPDRITRRSIENGTDHFTYEYTIELNTNDGFIDITPDGFKTVEGAECALGKLRFVFTPAFQVIKISRPWNETWVTPTMATRDTFSIIKNQIHHIESRELTSVCDVAELF